MTPIEIDTWASFTEAVHRTVEAALARDARTMCWVDPDFAAWPLDDVRLLGALTPWLRRPQRRLVLLGGRFERMERLHPRFEQWRAPWMHAIDARAPEPGPAADLPTVLFDDGPTLLALQERDPPRGRARQEASEAARWRELLDACLQRSSPAWPIKPLGL
jgi:hypothetical protein